MFGPFAFVEIGDQLTKCLDQLRAGGEFHRPVSGGIAVGNQTIEGTLRCVNVLYDNAERVPGPAHAHDSNTNLSLASVIYITIGAVPALIRKGSGRPAILERLFLPEADHDAIPIDIEKQYGVGIGLVALHGERTAQSI